jgi:glycosyltransferase involved in cell wall biosynthesis
VIPAFNEGVNLNWVIHELFSELEKIDAVTHVLIVDDGSTDETIAVATALTLEFPNLECLSLGRNRGKARALKEGFSISVAKNPDIVIMMDADGQDNPEIFPELVKEIESGWDLVTAARKQRKDSLVKVLTSKIYNSVTRVVSGAPGKDFNSGLKAMKVHVAIELMPVLYGELHRYITVLAFWFGFKLHEIPVSHRPRRLGTSKYGINRFWRGFIDLITVRFLFEYGSRPAHLFGAFGALLFAVGAGILAFLFFEWAHGVSIGGRPLLIAGLMTLLVGLQLLLFGLLAELIVFSSESLRKKWVSD